MIQKRKRVCVLTYQALHRKTIDTLTLLKIWGYDNVCIYAKPFHYIKKYTPVVPHRPAVEILDNAESLNYADIVINLGYELRNIENYEEIKEADTAIFLVCGAGLLPEFLLKKYRIINAHPGFLPVVRGLDALKWAIIEGKPIGVTTHLLGPYVDAGAIIERKMVPIKPNDTFHMVAWRQYEIEIQMLVRAVERIGEISLFTDGEGYPIHRRMPHEIEQKVYQEFETYKHIMCKEDD